MWTTDDMIDAYRRFLNGEPGVCVATGDEGAFAFASDDEIDTGYGSRHDGSHFVWLTFNRGPFGFVSDRWIDESLNERRIGLFDSDMARFDIADPEIARAAFLLGAERMGSVLALGTDKTGHVAPPARVRLSLPLRIRLERLFGDDTVPRARLAEAMVPRGLDTEQPEGAGRLAILVIEATRVRNANTRSTSERDDVPHAPFSLESIRRTNQNAPFESDDDALAEAAARWIDADMAARQRRERAAREEPALTALLTAAVEEYGREGYNDESVGDGDTRTIRQEKI